MEGPQWMRNTVRIFGVDDRNKAAAWCRENWGKEVLHVLETADRACGNTFLFDFQWDMERTWEPIHFEGEIDWSLIPWGDREFLWQFNRHRFLPCLAQTYQMTGKEKYAQNYVRLMTDWIDRVEEGENIDLGPWRTLETGIRAEMWLTSLPLTVESPAVDGSFLDKVETCLRKHCDRLLENFQPHKYISNWGVLEACGLLLLSLVLPDSQRALKTALKRLEDAARVQVLEDGMQWEQSPMYHNEVYHCFLTAYWYGQRAGIRMPKAVREAVRKMAYVNYKWKKPDHTQFAQGDSDASDLRDQITAGAYLLNDGVLKSGGYDILDYDSVWRFGWEACLEYGALKAEAPDFVSTELPFGGNYYFRSDWSEKADLLHFHCGETGGGHGHADKLHVDLVIRGEDVLVDSGRYTYVDGADRFWFKEASGHNVILVDGMGFAQCDTSWIYKNLCTCLKQQYFDGKLGAFVEGSHLGYWDRGVLVNRKVIWIKPDIYVIADAMLARGRHTYENTLHFDGRGKAESWSGGNGCEGIHFTGSGMEAFVQFTDPAPSEILDTEQSSYYNEKHANQTYRRKMEAEGFYREITVINGAEKGRAVPAAVEKIPLYSEINGEYLPENHAEGLRILLGDREYILFLCHQEVMTPTDILSWENCLGHGKAVLFDRTRRKDEIITGEILAW